MKRVILTVSQARDLQQERASWAFMAYPDRNIPDSLVDPERMVIALEMKRRECADDQIALQLGWRPNSEPLRQLNRRLATRT
jgi:hypothetical protein